MPTPYLKKLAKEGKGSLEELEKKWSEAKKIARATHRSHNYAVVTAIFKNLIGIKESRMKFKEFYEGEKRNLIHVYNDDE